MATRSSEISSNGCSPIDVAKVGYQLVRECFPLGPNQKEDSDLAVRTKIKLLAEVVEAVGPERFLRAVEQAIAVSPNRFQVSVARIREMAGLFYTPPRHPAVIAWETVIQVFLDHVRPNGDGNYQLENKVRIVDGIAVVTQPPAVPAASMKALRSIGGWAALAEAWPEWTAQTFKNFREFFQPEV